MNVGDGVFELHAQKLEQGLTDGLILLLELIDEVLDQAVGDVDALFWVHGFESAEDEVGEVLGENTRRLGVFDGVGLIGEIGGERLQLSG